MRKLVLSHCSSSPTLFFFPSSTWLKYSKQLESRSAVAASRVHKAANCRRLGTHKSERRFFLCASGPAGRLLPPHPAAFSSLNISYLLPNGRLDINSNTSTDLDRICLGSGLSLVSIKQFGRLEAQRGKGGKSKVMCLRFIEG